MRLAERAVYRTRSKKEPPRTPRPRTVGTTEFAESLTMEETFKVRVQAADVDPAFYLPTLMQVCPFLAPFAFSAFPQHT
jgi:hypothetical protein